MKKEDGKLVNVCATEEDSETQDGTVQVTEDDVAKALTEVLGVQQTEDIVIIHLHML